MQYKIGDTFIEKLKVFDGFGEGNKPIIYNLEKRWTVIAVEEGIITCSCGEEYKVFQVEGGKF